MYLKRKLSDSLTIFKGLRFADKKVQQRKLRYKATVGLGGNVGDVRRRFEHLLVVIKKDKRVNLLETSLILKNPPFGYQDQDDFFNSTILLETNMQPRTFLSWLMRLEKKFGRQRSFPNAPRTLDLDIIFFDDRVINSEKLTIPHPEWSNRESVIIPLASMR